MSGPEEAHESGGGKIGSEELFIFHFRCADSRGADEGFGGEISAADGAFHGRGPAGGGPITGEEDAGPRGGLRRTVRVDAGAGRVGGVDFLDHGGLQQGREAPPKRALAIVGPGCTLRAVGDAF